MSTQGSIEGVGRIIEVLKPPLFRVEMPNGHVVLGFLKKEANLVDRLVKGTQVRVAMTPFDMSKAEIVKILE